MTLEIFLELSPYFVGLALLLLGYVAGSRAEKRHYESIVAREKATLGLPVTSLRRVAFGSEVENAWLVAGCAVISVDYFKRFIAQIRNFIGGRVTSYESLIDRARREAVLRMKAEAAGADFILNVRLETSSIGGDASGRGSVGAIECYAYGTAIRRSR